MRPLKLIMKGFGPYRKETIIDFESLGTGGIYLITGDTGAGKTYIFDAITYALYGDMSGSGRDSKTVRSQYCDDDEATEVTLDFDYCGRRYKVTRNPEYSRRKKSGTGTTKQTAGASLIKPDGSIMDGSSKVTEAVKEILGIDRDQFCNIVMIAQGEFRKVLTAGTDERQKLFSRLFNTRPYNDLAEELKAKSRAIDAEFFDRAKAIDLAFESADCRFDDHLSMTLSEMKGTGAVSAEEKKRFLEEVISAGIIESEETDAELERSEAIFAEANSKAALIYENRRNAESLEQAKRTVSDLEKELSAARTELEKAYEQKPEIERLKNERALLVNSMESYEILDSTCKELSAELKLLKQQKESLTKAEKDTEKTLRDLNELSRNNEKVLNDERELLDSLLETAEQLEIGHSRMTSAYMRAQAGIIASGLEDGKPCPVCGSVDHPAPAELPDEAPDPEDLKTKEKAAKKARKSADEKAAYIHDLRDSQERKISEARKKYDECLSFCSELKSNITGAEANVNGIEKRIEERKNALSFGSRQDAECRIEEIDRLVKKKESSISDAEEKLNKASEALSSNRTKIAELEKVLSDHDPAEEEAVIKRRDSASAAKKALMDKKVGIAADLKACETALANITAGMSDLERIRREHELTDPLARTASGMLAGKERISLEAYVQTFFFDRIIRHANLRLRMMSDGQYEFVRSSSSGDFRHKSGLDLSVVDHYNGTERPVSTLSGGESFMASLSLALGLSDEVQSSAGGIRLDTMFIDEGFGSLDSETLEKAVRTLTGLADEDRLVGIISHVDALRSRIDKQIVVTKDRDSGSRAAVIV